MVLVDSCQIKKHELQKHFVVMIHFRKILDNLVLNVWSLTFCVLQKQKCLPNLNKFDFNGLSIKDNREHSETKGIVVP